MREIALVAARRHVVAAQGFAPRRRTASMGEMVAAIERLGCVQIDSISVVDRSQRLVLAARCGRVPAGGPDGPPRSRRGFGDWAPRGRLPPGRGGPHFPLFHRAPRPPPPPVRAAPEGPPGAA